MNWALKLACLLVLFALAGCQLEPQESNQVKLQAIWQKPYAYGLNEVEYWFVETGNVYVKDAAYCNSSGSSLITKSGTYDATDTTVIIHLSSGDVLFNYYFSSTDNHLNLYNYEVRHELRKR